MFAVGSPDKQPHRTASVYRFSLPQGRYEMVADSCIDDPSHDYDRDIFTLDIDLPIIGGTPVRLRWNFPMNAVVPQLQDKDFLFKEWHFQDSLVVGIADDPMRVFWLGGIIEVIVC